EAAAGVNLTLEDVRNVLVNSSVNHAKGTIGGQELSTTLAADDQLRWAAQYEPLILAQTANSTVRLEAVALVMDDVQNPRDAGWGDEVRSALTTVRRQPGANIIETVDRIKALLPLLASSISPAIDITVASDRTQTIRASVFDVERALLISICLVVLVV